LLIVIAERLMTPTVHWGNRTTTPYVSIALAAAKALSSLPKLLCACSLPPMMATLIRMLVIACAMVSIWLARNDFTANTSPSLFVPIHHLFFGLPVDSALVDH